MSLFITFEGPDGSGKTTQIELLTAYLRTLGYDVLITREPGGTSIGDQIRDVLHDVKNLEMTDEAECLLYSASRAQLVHEVLRPHLARGGIVLCDRFADSSMAYQGYGRELDLKAIHFITQFATGGLRPHLTVYLDLPAEVGIERKHSAHTAEAGEWNRLDQQTLDFHRRVRQGYLKMAEAEPSRWLVVDATRSITDTQATIRMRLELLLSKAKKVTVK
ncbi:MAG: dTMP kinase [Anaerolineales bacterium]|nr:MAG: dTMP kinase [Anaerolineales bacterium]